MGSRVMYVCVAHITQLQEQHQIVNSLDNRVLEFVAFNHLTNFKLYYLHVLIGCDQSAWYAYSFQTPDNIIS